MTRNLVLFSALLCSSFASIGQSLDATFGTNGTVQHHIGGSERLFGVAVQPDGRIVACGLRDSIGMGHVLVARFFEDGSFDPSFGAGGWVMLPTGTNYSEASEVLIQPDGRIVVAGKTVVGNIPGFMVRRLMANGEVDNSFGTDGVWMASVLPDGGYAQQIALDPLGRILVAGAVVPSNFFAAFAVVRLDANGMVDPTFGTNGFFIMDGSTQFLLYQLADMELLPDGAILVAGSKGDLSTGPDWNTDVLCVKLMPDGGVDNSFGNNGERLVDLQGMDDGATAIRLQPNGEVDLFGTSTYNNTIGVANRCRLSASGDVLFTELFPLSAWSPVQEHKQINELMPGPGGVVAYIGTVPNGGTTDGFLGLIEPSPIQGLPYQAGFSTTLDPGDWTTFGSGAYDASGRLLLVGLTTNADWIGQFPDACGVFTDLYMARFNMPMQTAISEQDDDGLEVWPTPASEQLNVRTPSGTIDQVLLIDMAGRTVLDQVDSGTASLVIDTQAIANGAYGLVVTNGSRRLRTKVVVQH